MTTDPSDTSSRDRDTLDLHRRQIDRIDLTILALLRERVRLGLSLGAIKRAIDLPIRAPVREAEVLTRVCEAASAPLSRDGVERIFTAIIEETAASQERDDDAAR